MEEIMLRTQLFRLIRDKEREKKNVYAPVPTWPEAKWQV